MDRLATTAMFSSLSIKSMGIEKNMNGLGITIMVIMMSEKGRPAMRQSNQCLTNRTENAEFPTKRPLHAYHRKPSSKRRSNAGQDQLNLDLS